MSHLRRDGAGRAQAESRVTRLARLGTACTRRACAWIAIIALIAPVSVVSPRADTTPIDLALALAVDVSDSIDTGELQLQREGYMAAIEDPRVLHAIQSGRYGRIALAYFEWADADRQTLIVDWMVVSDLKTAHGFAERLRSAPMLNGHFTSISGALAFAGTLLQRRDFRTERRIVDISGDGKNNNGPPVGPARARLLELGITINGLAIVDPRSQLNSGMPPEHIDRYYHDHVIGGDGAFVVVVRKAADFEEAISQKLLREITMATANPAVARKISE